MLFVLLIFSVMTHGAPSGVIHELLQKVTAKSNAIKAVENLNLSNQLLLDSDRPVR